MGGRVTAHVCMEQNELPGPGQYHKPPSLVRTQLESGSVSRLGYSTGFVSKAKRFDDRARDAGPGPGAYQQPKYSSSYMYRVPGSKLTYGAVHAGLSGVQRTASMA